MQEEFHGIWNNGAGPFKQLYGWGTITANVWLPSVSELVGIAGNQNTNTGVYLSAMQGLNISVNYYVDAQGGDQFAYFKQYNTSGGGQKIWDACNQQVTWLRSSAYATATHAWCTSNPKRFDYTGLTASHAVHPAVWMQVSCCRRF